MSIDTRETQRLGSGGALGDTFYPAYQWAFDEEGEFVKSVEKKLGQARMADNVEMFLARAMAVGTLSGVALWLVGTLVGYLAVTMLFAGATDAPTFLGLTGLPEGVVAVINAVKIPFLIVVTGVVFGAIGFGIGFRIARLDPLLPCLGAKTRSQRPPLRRHLVHVRPLCGRPQPARNPPGDGEGRRHLRRVCQGVPVHRSRNGYFDTDYRTAIRNQALETPLR